MVQIFPKSTFHLNEPMVGAGLVAVGLVLFLGAATEEGDASTSEFVAVALPTTTTTTTTTLPPDPDAEPEVIDVSQFGTDRPTGLVDGVLWDYLTEAGGDPQAAVCTGTVLLERISADELLASGLVPDFPDEQLVPVVQAGLDCGIDQATIDAAVVIARGG